MTRSVMIALGLIALGAAAVEAGEEHFLLVFGADADPRHLQYVHTFATFVRTSWDDAAQERQIKVESFTMSWEPESLIVRVWSAVGERGKNLDLYATLQRCLSQGQALNVWGPIKIRRGLYETALLHRDRLERGLIRYRAIDTAFDSTVSDCIHAITDCDPDFGRYHFPLIRLGHSAAQYIAREVIRTGVYDQRKHDARWLISYLGIDRYPIKVILPSEMKIVQDGKTRAARYGERPDLEEDGYPELFPFNVLHKWRMQHLRNKEARAAG